jgi:CTP:molybdopterin cytidylyltransferase MocA
MTRLVAIVLAAGRGTRVGGPKALLRVGGETFLARAARVLRRPGVQAVVAGLGHAAARVRTEAGLGPEVRLVVNEAYDGGMLTSIVAGLAAAEGDGADAVLLHPVDHPLVDPATVDRVIAALAAGAVIAVPSDGRRRGHPAGFARAAWDALRAAPADRGARAVLAAHPEWIVHVEGDPGALEGINTPEDYRRLIEGGKP